MSARLYILFFLSCAYLQLPAQLEDSLLAHLHQQTEEEQLLSLLELGEQKKHRPQQAIPYYQAALELAEKLEHQEALFQASSQLALMLRYVGKMEASLIYHQQYLQLAQSANDSMQQANAFLRIGLLYDNLGEFQQAKKSINQGIKICKGIGYTKKQIALYSAKGSLMEKQGKWKQALKSYQASLLLAEQSHDSVFIAGVAGNVGHLYLSMNQPEKALIYFRDKSLLFFLQDSINYKRSIANAYNNMGIAYLQLQQYQKAEEVLKKSLKLKHQLNYMRGIAHSLNNLGDVARERMQSQKAIEYYQESIRIKQELQDPKGLCTAYLPLAQAYLQLGESKLAKTYLQKGIDIAQSLDLKKELADYHQSLAYVDSLHQNYASALQHQHQAKRLQTQLLDYRNAFLLADMELELHQRQTQRERNILQEHTNLHQAQEKALQLGISILGILGLGILLAIIVYLLLLRQTRKRLQLIRQLHDLAKNRKSSLEAMISQRTQAIQESHELLEEYAYINSHKVRAPLARIIGLSSILKDYPEGPKQSEFYISLLHFSAQELKQIIEEIKHTPLQS